MRLAGPPESGETEDAFMNPGVLVKVATPPPMARHMGLARSPRRMLGINQYALGSEKELSGGHSGESGEGEGGGGRGGTPDSSSFGGGSSLAGSSLPGSSLPSLVSSVQPGGGSGTFETPPLKPTKPPGAHAREHDGGVWKRGERERQRKAVAMPQYKVLNSLYDGTKPTKEDVQLALSTNTDFWWEKLRVQIEHRSLHDGEDGLGHLTRSQIFKGSVPPVWELGRGASFRRPKTKTDSIAKLDAEVLDALRQYLLLCLALRTAPSSHFLQNPASTSLNVRGRLVPRIKSIQSLAAAIASTSWITELDFSSNDLKSTGTTALCTALCMSGNPVERLCLDDNNINSIILDYHDEVLPMEEVEAEAGSADPLMMPFSLLQPWPDPYDRGFPSAVIGETVAAEAICQVLACKHLTSLSLAHNHLGNAAIILIAEAAATSITLTELSLAENNGQKTLLDTGATALGQMIASSQSIKSLDLRWNSIRGIGAVTFATALAKNTSLTRLELGWNCFGRKSPMAALKEALFYCKLVHLDLSHNGIDEKTAFLLGSGLAYATLLQSLNLDGNRFNQVGAREIQDNLVRADEDPVALSMNECGVNSKMARDFDPAEPAGVYSLELKEEYSKKVLVNLVRIAQEGNGKFEQGSVTLNGRPYYISLAAIEEYALTRLPGTEGAALALLLKEKPPLTRGQSRLGKPPLTRGQSRAMSGFSDLLSDAFPGKGPPSPRGSTGSSQLEASPLSSSQASPLAAFPQPPASAPTADALPVKSSLKLAGIASRAVSRVNPQGKEQPVPETGLLEFKFSSTMKPPTEGQELSDGKMLAARAVTCDTSLTKHVLINALAGVLKGHVLSASQAVDLMRLIPEFDTEKRVALVECVYSRLSDPANAFTLLEMLRDHEYENVVNFLGSMAFNFTTNNPTGHHVLNLSMETERQVAVRLVTLKNRELVLEEQANNKARGREAVRFDRVWRNVKMNRRPFQYSTSWAVPRAGILELDFTQISKPDVSSKPITGEELHLRIDTQWEDTTSGWELCSCVRQLSNDVFFTCFQVQKLLHVLTQAAYLSVSSLNQRQKEPSALKRWRNRRIAQAFATWTLWIKSRGYIGVLSAEGVEELKRLQVELVVTCYARIVDWHGIRPLILETLDRGQRNMLETRIGAFNLFDHCVAVGLYDLDLENKEHRRIGQELVYLGSAEPGRNFLDVTYNEKDFVIPSGWMTNLPTKGHLAIHYCREQSTTSSIKASLEGDPSWPAGYTERHGTGWVVWQRLKTVKEKLRETFDTGKEAFNAMDRDKEGTLDRTEIAVQLFAFGVWLAPKEISAMMDVLDEDNSGDVDLDEWTAFWNSNIDLDSGKLTNMNDDN